MTDQLQRDKFEAWYVADMLRQTDIEMTTEEMRELREGNHYGFRRTMLNGKWEGWQAAAEAITEEQYASMQAPAAQCLGDPGECSFNRACMYQCQGRQAPAAPADADGEAFRKAAQLGLTLRFYGGCAQSGMPGSPSAYEVVNDADRAASMREAIDRAATVIANGGEPQRDEPAAPASTQQAPVVDHQTSNLSDKAGSGSQVSDKAPEPAGAYAELPEPDTHCFDEDAGKDVWSHSPDQMRAFADATHALRAGREGTLADQEPVAWMTHHEPPMLFPTWKEAALLCDEDEEPIALYQPPNAAMHSKCFTCGEALSPQSCGYCGNVQPGQGADSQGGGT